MNKFYEVMKEKPDAKLLEIVERKRKDYEPEAVSAAEAVLQERNISWTIAPETKQDFSNTKRNPRSGLLLSGLLVAILTSIRLYSNKQMNGTALAAIIIVMVVLVFAALLRKPKA